MIRIAIANSQRDFASTTFGISPNCSREDIVQAVDKILTDHPETESPIGLSIGSNKEKGTKFGTLAWLGMKNLFGFLNACNRRITISSPPLSTSASTQYIKTVIELHPRFDEFPKCSDLLQGYNFSNYAEAAEIANLLTNSGLTTSEFFIKLGTKTNIDYVLLLAPQEKRSTLLPVLKKRIPEMILIPVSPDRKLHEKPVVQKRNVKIPDTSYGQIPPAQVQSHQRKIEILTQLVRTISLELSEIKEKMKKQQEEGGGKTQEAEIGEQSPLNKRKRKRAASSASSS